jgi:hypothetical protein
MRARMNAICNHVEANGRQGLALELADMDPRHMSVAGAIAALKRATKETMEQAGAREASYLLGKSAPEVPDGLDAFRTKRADDPGLFASRYKAGAREAAILLGKPCPEFAR